MMTPNFLGGFQATKCQSLAELNARNRKGLYVGRKDSSEGDIVPEVDRTIQFQSFLF